jgi:peptidyl-prolyl cis-trans isomerase D
MFDFIRNNRRLLQVFLLILILPSFALFGIQGYSDTNNANHLVTVAKQPITQAELDNAVRNQLEQVKSSLGDKYDAKIYDTPQARERVLDGLINQKILQAEVSRNHLAATDEKLLEFVKTLPGVYEANQLNEEAYKRFVSTRVLNGNISVFEAGVKSDIGVQSLLTGLQASAIVPKQIVEKILAAQERTLTVQSLLFKPETYASSVKFDAAAVNKYYTTHFKRFEKPESASVEYIVLDSSKQSVNQVVALSEPELKAYYDAEIKKKRFTTPEERQVSHILYKLDPKASTADTAAAKAKADAALTQLKKDITQFEIIAKQSSDDTGSAAQGGDLGLFTQASMSVMGKPFVDTAFTLKENELSAPIKTEYGWHIIRVTSIKPAQIQAFEAVKAELETELKSSKIASLMLEKKKNLSNALGLLEPSSSLKRLADEFGLELNTIADFNRALINQANYPKELNAKLVDALLSKESIDTKANTGLIEISKGVWVVARLLNYVPAKTPPLESIKTTVESQLRQELALKQAKIDGEAKLKLVRSKPTTELDGLSLPQVISRHNRNGLPIESFAALVRASVGVLPAWTGVTLPTGEYAIFKITAVGDAPLMNQSKIASARHTLNQVYGEQEAQAMLAVLKNRHKVKVLNKPTISSDTVGSTQ